MEIYFIWQHELWHRLLLWVFGLLISEHSPLRQVNRHVPASRIINIINKTLVKWQKQKRSEQRASIHVSNKYHCFVKWWKLVPNLHNDNDDTSLNFVWCLCDSHCSNTQCKGHRWNTTTHKMNWQCTMSSFIIVFFKDKEWHQHLTVFKLLVWVNPIRSFLWGWL